MSEIKTHTSYHGSGLTNSDYSGSSGTEHYHEKKDGSVVETWEHPTAGTLTKGSDGVWRKSDGSVFRGGAS